MLSCHAISLERGQHCFFQELGVTLGDGGLLLIKGPNGSGKTTLLKMMAGILRPEMGQVTWDGELIQDNLEDYREQICFVGHKNGLKGTLSVRENLQFITELCGEPLLLAAAIAYFKLEEVLDVPVNQLSAGWQRRVGLSRLIIANKPVWLLDEPIANMDTEAIELLVKLIATRCDQGGMVVLSTHQPLDLPFGMELMLHDFRPREAVDA
jgi:heme exporter protein A